MMGFVRKPSEGRQSSLTRKNRLKDYNTKNPIFFLRRKNCSLRLLPTWLSHFFSRHENSVRHTFWDAFESNMLAQSEGKGSWRLKTTGSLLRVAPLQKEIVSLALLNGQGYFSLLAPTPLSETLERPTVCSQTGSFSIQCYRLSARFHFGHWNNSFEW